jgi:glycosyltransferase involved in cell wall biosynthesis
MNPATPNVSIVTVVRDDARKIAQTLDSVLSQRDADLELVVVDGASRDGTQAIVQGYGPRIGAFLSEPDRGIYDAMNKGLALARGEYVLMMNSGDIFASDRALSSLLRATRPGVEQAVFGAWERLSSNGHCTRCQPAPERGFFNHQAVMYSRSLHRRFGAYVCAPGFSTADYLFFNIVLAASDVVCSTIDAAVARIDVSGVSAGLQTISQKYAIDHLFGRSGRIKLLAVLALHPAYHGVKRFLSGTR